MRKPTVKKQNSYALPMLFVIICQSYFSMDSREVIDFAPESEEIFPFIVKNGI